MKLLNQAYDRGNYLDFLADKFNFAKHLVPIVIDNNDVESLQQLGTVTSQDGKSLPVFEIHIKPNTQLSRNRVQLRNLVAKQIGSEDGALAVYVDDENKQWRFSFIAIEYRFTDTGVTTEKTASKRFTYLLGENAKTRTAIERFEQLHKQSTLEDLKAAFSVEELNKEFYDKLYRWYEKAQCEVVFPNDERTDNHSQTSLIRLLTRLLFIWFIKEKGLIKADLFDKDKLQTLIDYEQPSSFYKAILQNLFFATLNRPVTERSFRNTTNGAANSTNYLVTNIYRYQDYFIDSDKDKIIALFDQTPFLNGGLFECLDREASDEEKQAYDNDKTIRPIGSAIRIDGFSDRADNELVFHNHLFFKDTIFNDNKQDNEQDLGLIDLFNQYQFTVEESTPLDVEVALDPELLGKVFENLLASYNPETGQQARKATGSFYTPREIVNYMVDESLKQHFHQHTDLTDKQINALFVDAEFTEQENALNKQQTKALIYAIDGLKILDPAVGSGAYPMGILQRLVLILEKVDAENTHFKQQQIDKAEQIPDEASCASAIAAIEQVFSQQNQHNAYGKKLMLIENCIYGVDIQPIAIQICKLRFFISLTIEQSPNKSKADNYGIKALPNLETKFIVANSLLPLGEMPKQKGIFDTGIEELQTKLAQVRHKHFSAKTLTTKRKYRDKDKDLREQMLAELSKSGVTPAVEASMRKIVHWDLYNQNAVADWFNPEWQFGVNGFDIVIGNPPYISHDKISKKDKKIIQNNYLSYEPFADLYCYFFEKSVTLQREKGILCLITSNSFLRAEYGKPTRYFLSNNNCLLKVFNIHKSQIFDKAIVNVSIVISCKIKGDIVCDVINSKIGDKFSELIKNTLPYKQIYFDESPWRLIPPKLITLKNKIKSTGKTLEESQTKIRLGLATGSNEAFVIDEKTKQQLCANSKNSDIIKPILRGRDIDKYSYRISGLYILLTKNGVNVRRDYPEIYAYLLSFGDKFKNRGAQGEHWSNLRACSFYDDFKKDKIIWIELTDKGRFSLSTDEVYLLNSAYYLIPPEGVNSKFLLAILNSKIIYFYLNLIAETSGMGTNRWINNYVKKFPIPQISKPAQQPFIALVNKILTAKQQAQDTRTLETEIDQMVYKLYDLTDNEIKIIENNATPDLVIPAKAGIQ